MCSAQSSQVAERGRDLHAVVVDISAEAMLGAALELADVDEVRRAAGGDDLRIQPVRAHAGQRLVIEFLRVRPAGLGRIEHEAGEFEPLGPGDLARQRNRLGRRLDAGALAAGIAFDHHRERTA
ncbi:hypothetical protein ABIF53_008800 [Bradyrhizobium japonicum]